MSSRFYLYPCPRCGQGRQIVITKYWDYHQHFFGRDRETFDFYMNHINKYRIDSHAKDISDDDFQVIVSAFNWFDKKLEEFPFI
jgi:hypothetical protein